MTQVSHACNFIIINLTCIYKVVYFQSLISFFFNTDYAEKLQMHMVNVICQILQTVRLFNKENTSISHSSVCIQTMYQELCNFSTYFKIPLFFLNRNNEQKELRNL